MARASTPTATMISSSNPSTSSSSATSSSASASPSSGTTASIVAVSTGFVVPVEIVDDEEMAFLEAALASTRSLLSSSTSSPASLCCASPRLALLSPVSQRRVSSLRPPWGQPQPTSAMKDIEDSSDSPPLRRPSLLRQFRSRRALAVTDITATEWCEKQMEFALILGKPKRTEAMIAGSNRHAQLEKEVVEKVQIQIESVEESWALKLMNFIVGANQLIFEGLTRELPIIGVIEGIWVTGVIDEIRMQKSEDTRTPFLVDIKTRFKATLPSEAQKRNARLQLMCYKYLWDNLVSSSFPLEHFLDHFGLNRLYMFSGPIKDHIASFGFHVKTFEDVFTYFLETCCLLSPSMEQLLLRYELQSDHSLLEEHHFSYDASLFHKNIQECYQFWSGEREARFVSGDERWKCRFCAFTTLCPASSTSKNISG